MAAGRGTVRIQALAAELLEEEEVCDLVERDDDAGVGYDGSHASIVAFSASHSSLFIRK